MAVGKCQCKEYIFPRANHQYGKKKLPNVTVKIPEKTALDIALSVAQEHFA